MTKSKFVSIAEAARSLGVTRKTVYAWIKRGALITQVHPANGRTLVSVDSINFVFEASRSIDTVKVNADEIILERIKVEYLHKIVEGVEGHFSKHGSLEDVSDTLMEYVYEAIETTYLEFASSSES